MEARHLPSHLKAGIAIVVDILGKREERPAVSASAVRGKDGVVHVAMSNADPNRPTTVSAALTGINGATVTGRVLTAPTITAHNTFDNPNAVTPTAFTGAQVANGTLTVTLPAKSVVMLGIK